MRDNPTQIVLSDASTVIMFGLKEVMVRGDLTCEFNLAENFSALHSSVLDHEIDIVLINPSQILNIEKQWLQLKAERPEVKWIAVCSQLFDEALLVLFDARILLTDQPDTIRSVVKTTLGESRSDDTMTQQPLSDREIEVLRLLVQGHSNKEIADKLFISTYTVISHRKNITQKTSIKSVSGLTIYAVVKGIISLNSLPE